MCEENNYIYRITINCEEGISLIIYTNGPKDCEEELLDFIHQKYWDVESDITKYKIINLSKEPEVIKKKKSFKTLHIDLAIKAIEYSEDFQ